MTISVLHRPISPVEEDNPRRNAFERMLLFALFMKRKKKKRKRKEVFQQSEFCVPFEILVVCAVSCDFEEAQVQCIIM